MEASGILMKKVVVDEDCKAFFYKPTLDMGK
jgi:hypothetical protein